MSLINPLFISLLFDTYYENSICSRSALQTLHRVSAIARKNNFYAGGLSHKWVKPYESRIHSDRSCLNEWHAMDALESRRPLSPDSLRTKYENSSYKLEF